MTVYSLLLIEDPIKLGRRGEIGGDVEDGVVAIGTLLLPFHDAGVLGGLIDELPYELELEFEPAIVGGGCFRLGMGMEDDILRG